MAGGRAKPRSRTLTAGHRRSPRRLHLPGLWSALPVLRPPLPEARMAFLEPLFSSTTCSQSPSNPPQPFTADSTSDSHSPESVAFPPTLTRHCHPHHALDPAGALASVSLGLTVTWAPGLTPSSPHPSFINRCSTYCIVGREGREWRAFSFSLSLFKKRS